MEFWYLVTTFSLLILTTEAKLLFYKVPYRVRAQQSVSEPVDQSGDVVGEVAVNQHPPVTFTSLEYDTQTTDQPVSSILTNDMTIRRVITNDPLPNERFATLGESPEIANKIENVFRNIFDNDTNNTICYFGDAFQRNEQYYEFEINPVGNVHISIGFGYASNYSKLKGWTAEFDVNSKTSVLLSKNDNNGEIEVEIQSGSEKVVLTSPEDPQYRPVVCLKGEVHYINVKLFNGMKMASITSGTAVIDLPIAGMKLKFLTTEKVRRSWTTYVRVQHTAGLLGLGLIETHTLTSTAPETYIFTGYFFDGLNWWMSPSLVDKLNTWGNGEKYSEIDVTSTSMSLSVWPQGREGYSVTVDRTGREWKSQIFAIYDTSRSAHQEPTAIVRLRPDWVTEITKHNCSGLGTCLGSNECHWPRSDRQNLLPGVCINKVCKIIIEAQLQTGLYKPDGDRRIGGETALRLIAPSDVGVEKKGIAMIKALLDRAEDFENIEPTGDYEFGGVIDPPSGASGPQKRYFNFGDRYYDGDEHACDTDGEFFRILSNTGIPVGLGIKVEKYDFIICQPFYGLVTNLVTNSLDVKKLKAVDTYENKHYQRVDPNIALDDYDSQGDYDRDWPDWPASLPKELTDNLYYNNDNPDADHYYSRDRLKFFNKNRYSAVTELSLGLSSAFEKCVDYYFNYDLPVYHVTTFVRQRMQDGNPIDKYYTEFHALLWHYGLYYLDIDFTEREMTLYDENNIPSWFINKNGADPEVVEAGYTCLPDLHTGDDSPPNPQIT